MGNLLSVYLTGSTAFLLAWCVPYEYVAKVAVFRWVRKQRFFRLLWRLSPVLAAGLLVMCVIELKNFWAAVKTQRQVSARLLSNLIASDNDIIKRILELTKADHSVYASVVRLSKASAGLLFSLFTRRALGLVQTDLEELISMEANQLERELVRFRPPGKAVISTLASPYRRVLAPVFLGWENIPADAHLKPILFVSNHTVMAFDFPLFLDEIYRKRGLFPRVLADHSHFQIPVNSEILRTFFGAVDGTRKNVDVLMAAKKCLFVYPGGAREVFKRTTDTPYDLMWDGKQGFAIMAIKHGCTIVPVINYGTEDMLTVIADLPLGWLPVPFLWGSNRTLPIMKPAEKNAVRRIYFLFGQPISTEAVKGQEANQEVVDTVKQQTQQAIEDGLGFLKEYARMERLERKQKRLLKKAQLPASASKKRQDDNTDALRALAEEIKASSKRLQSTTKLPATL